MKTVLRVRVDEVVGKVSASVDTSDNAVLVRKTSAKDGAGTLTAQVLAWVSQLMV
jgi:hypothetical protein